MILDPERSNIIYFKIVLRVKTFFENAFIKSSVRKFDFVYTMGSQ